MIHVFTAVKEGAEVHHFCKDIPINLPAVDTFLELQVGTEYRLFFTKEHPQNRWSEKIHAWVVYINPAGVKYTGTAQITDDEYLKFAENCYRATPDGMPIETE